MPTMDTNRRYSPMLHGVATTLFAQIITASTSPDIDLLKYLSEERQKEDKVYDNQKLIRTPVVRNGKLATVGFCPEVWETWK